MADAGTEDEVEGTFPIEPIDELIPGTEDPGIETTEDYDDQR